MKTDIFERFIKQLDTEAKEIVKSYRDKTKRQLAAKRFYNLFNFPHLVLKCAGKQGLNKGTWSGIIKEWCVFFVVKAFANKECTIINNCGIKRLPAKKRSSSSKHAHINFDIVVVKKNLNNKDNKFEITDCDAIFEIKTNSDDRGKAFDDYRKKFGKRKVHVYFVASDFCNLSKSINRKVKCKDHHEDDFIFHRARFNSRKREYKGLKDELLQNGCLSSYDEVKDDFWKTSGRSKIKSDDCQRFYEKLKKEYKEIGKRNLETAARLLRTIDRVTRR